MELKSEDVFRPGAFPEYTYISRKSAVSNLPYEFRLNQVIKVSGFLTSLVGPSKMGKTILCEKVIGFDKIVEVSGADFNGAMDFWKLVAAKAGLAYEGQFSTEHIIMDTQDRYGKKEEYSLTKDKIIDYYNKENLILVIDDFHYAPEEKRMQVAQQLKDAIRRGFKAIVVSVPHRADEAIRQNADLSGRLSLINIESWKVEDLKEIAKVGFAKLNIRIDEDIAQMIAVESLSSPQLMQYICLNICTILEIDSSNKNVVETEILETAYRYTTANFEYGDVVTLMKKGPNTRGKNRNQFLAKDGKDYDMYELIVKSIAENPPMMKLEFDTIKKRINEIIADECKKPTQQAIKESLMKLQELLDEREDIFKVLDWKEGVFYILDPLFFVLLEMGRAGVIMFGPISLQHSMRLLSQAETEEEFERAVSNIKNALRDMEVTPECIQEVGKRAYYLSNDYSEKDTKEKIEQAKKRIQDYINEMMDISLDDKRLLSILENFYLFLEGLLEREPHKSGGIQKEQLESLSIKNEYDVQHLLFAYVRPLYPMARTEVSEDTGYNTVRVDIALDAKNVIEVKCTRKGMAQKKLVEEIEADMVHYSAECIYFFIYDKEKIIENSFNFKHTYEKKVTNKQIHIIIHQPKIL